MVWCGLVLFLVVMCWLCAGGCDDGDSDGVVCLKVVMIGGVA